MLLASFRRLLILCLLCMATATTARGQDPRLSGLQGNAAPPSTHMMHILGREVRASMGPAAFDAQISVAARDATRLPLTLEAIAARYDRSRRDNEIGLLVLQGNRELIKGSIALAGAYAPSTGGGSLILAGLGYAADKGLAAVEEEFRSSAQASLQRTLRTQLDAFRAQANDEEYQRLIRSGDPHTFRTALERRTGPLLGSALDGISGEDRQVVQAFYNKELATLLRDGFSGLAGVQAAQGEELAALQKNVAGLSLTFTRFAETTTRQLDQLHRTQTEIQTELSSMNERLGNTERGVAFLTQYTFGRMTPSEQLAALSAGILNVDDPTRREMERQIKLVQRREELNQTITSYLNGAGNMVQIASDLGVDPRIVQRAGQAVAIGNAAFNAFQAFSTGNYLSGVAAVTGLMGGFGNRDAGAARHKQIMSALGALFEQNEQIKRKLDDLERGQRQILRNQQAIYEAVIDLSQQVAANHSAQMALLEEVRNDVLYNRRLVMARVAEQYGQCRTIEYFPGTDKPRIDTERRRYPTVRAFASFYLDRSVPINDCLHKLASTVADGNGDFLTYFHLRAYENPTPTDRASQDPGRVQPAQTARFIASVFQPSLDLLRVVQSESGTSGSQRLTVASLFVPSQTVEALDRKATGLAPVDTLRFGRDTEALLSSLLSPRAVETHARFVSNYHVYYMLLDPIAGRPYTSAQLFSPDHVLRRTGYEALRQTRNLLDVAIAQQNLLTGDALLPGLLRLFDRQGQNPTQQERLAWDQAQQLLARNVVLAENFVLYAMRHEVIGDGDALLYHVALGSRNDGLLRRVVTRPWPFRYRPAGDTVGTPGGALQPQGWSAEFAGTFVPLPNIQQLAEGRLKTTADLYGLLLARDRVIDEMASYEVLADISGEDATRFNGLILSTLGSAPASP